MTATATTAMLANTTNWILVRLVRCMSRALVEMVGNSQRVARGIGAGQLADGATPLQLQLCQLALKESAGQEGRIEPAQCQVDDRGQIRVVAPEPFIERRLGEREGCVEIQRTGQRRSGIGQ